ncbi:hypothetical protein UCRPC4_g00848 [Phaeomoniella chlamydospora]|uniref:Reverse transcriptase n=1 Tax=Phaeomoniella chlamydospora TaxID=158046 RepID=A0A0G2GXG6_PHACM|nr:hypothetical protein UCRPC4_g00848 [Phaeomoniella chlamydospora]
MASSGSVFSKTLQEVTTTKLDELSKQREVFERQKSIALSESEEEDDAVGKLDVLSKGIRRCFSANLASANTDQAKPPLELDLGNISRFLQQAYHDPSVSSTSLERWHKMLLQHLHAQSLKYEYASLYGRLTMEWLSSTQQDNRSPQTEDIEMYEGFEPITDGAKLESRAKWESFVFDPIDVDQDAVHKLMDDIFGNRADDSNEVPAALEAVRTAVESFESQMTKSTLITPAALVWIIAGLTSSDLLTEEKRTVLKDFKQSPVILSEIADVLNMRMTSLSAWSWGEEVGIEERRQLNGSYNIYMHEDLLQAMLLQFIGVKWSVMFKKAFSDFRNKKNVWDSPRKHIPPIDKKRRDYYLEGEPTGPSVLARRQKIYQKSFFLTRLLNFDEDELLAEQGEEEAQFETQVMPQQAPVRRQMASMATRKVSINDKRSRKKRRLNRVESISAEVDDSDNEDDDEDEGNNRPRSVMEIKHSLLHLLSAEILIKTRLQGEITCFRSQFDQWNPSLPHTTILSVLAFFGVSEKWIAFFKTFLEAPLKFIDDETSTPRQRKRGTPGSHMLSDVFGEVILFCLDFAVNRYTDGENLWRIQDDIWFWSSNHETCVKAWDAITRFTQTMKVTLNPVRTGTVRIVEQNRQTTNQIHSSLPQGQIRWGMLVLNPESGRFEIDQSLVDRHIKELAHQLQAKGNSVFSWIQAWNTYATTFFTSNFGKPANCFGQAHVDEMLNTHKRIQQKIFSNDNTGNASGNVVKYLKNTITQRFGLTNIPDGYLFFPVELGGLELQSSFINLLQIRDSICSNPSQLLDKFLLAERSEYYRSKKAFETRHETDWRSDPKFRPKKDADIFMTFEEYTLYREELPYSFDDELVDIFDQLLKQPVEHAVDGSPQTPIWNALNGLI